MPVCGLCQLDDDDGDTVPTGHQGKGENDETISVADAAKDDSDSRTILPSDVIESPFPLHSTLPALCIILHLSNLVAGVLQLVAVDRRTTIKNYCQA